MRTVVGSARPVAEVARELRMSARTLQGWVARYRSFVPPEIRDLFLAALDGTELPDPLPLNRTINIYYEVAESLAEERGARGIYQVRAGYDGTYHLDCYLENHALMLLSTHYRLRADGSTQTLESLRTGRSLADPAAAREAERVAEHNARVREILKAKGFG